MIKIKKIDIEKTRLEIESHGFVVIKNIIDVNLIMELKEFWLNKINEEKKYKSFVRGGLVLGEENFFSYTKSVNWILYRAFEFPWNKPLSKKTKMLMARIHKVRNKIQNFDENYGLLYNEKNYGTYTSVSYYPQQIGYFEYHRDGHGNVPILHFMIPLTFKGIDYKTGGLSIETNSGKLINVDDIINPGDLIFFDGRNMHGVDHPKGAGSTNIPLGRLAVFEIPTFFLNDSQISVFKRSMKIFFQNLFLLRIIRKILILFKKQIKTDYNDY